jgi:hypothetical protein
LFGSRGFFFGIHHCHRMSRVSETTGRLLCRRRLRGLGTDYAFRPGRGAAPSLKPRPPNRLLQMPPYVVARMALEAPARCSTKRSKSAGKRKVMRQRTKSNE